MITNSSHLMLVLAIDKSLGFFNYKTMKTKNEYLEEILKMFGGKFVGTSSGLAKVLGSRDAGCLATQLIYWHNKGRNPDGWIYKSRNDIKEEIWIGRRALKTAINICEKAGILETKLEIPEFGKGPTMHFRLIDDGIKKLSKKYNSMSKITTSITIKERQSYEDLYIPWVE